MSSHHFQVESQSAAELADQVLINLDDPAQLLEVFAGLTAVRVADDLVLELRSRPVPREKLRVAARFVAEHATRREVAKLGIVLLGISGDQRDSELLQLLGSLEEFALFAVVALMNTQPDRQRAVFELAKRLDGWGRIHAVERLRGCSDPEIKAWLLREGYSNGVLDEYLAYIAATTGGLYEALLDDDIDDALLDGAGGILRALANLRGPTANMRSYDDAVPVMHRFAEHLDRAAPTLGRLRTAQSLQELCRQDDFEWPEEEPARLQARYQDLLSQPRWRELVLGELADEAPEHRGRFHVALTCAGKLGMDVFAHALDRLRNGSDDAFIWQWAMDEADETTVEQVVALAEEILPLDNLASGPTESLGLGRDFEADMALEFVVRPLSEYPGQGSRLLPVALSNRVIRCRRAALGALRAWPPEQRPPEAHAWITEAAEREPDPDLRRELLAFLTD
ncbi:hypothetical protein [Nocardia sp. XZ_19_385]|uniref:hypothetical protein n=1 Tax=Nocardia sp. XZ_19_385 TaxID=2769488 RepID=UPI00188FD6F4|nr:hypothetical protein [Nocardia sp. XZ_19_385]